MIGRALMSGMISSGTKRNRPVSAAGPDLAATGRGTTMCQRFMCRLRRSIPARPMSAIFDDHGLDVDKRSERKLEGLFFAKTSGASPTTRWDVSRRRDQQTERYLEDLISKLDLRVRARRSFQVVLELQQRRGRDGAATDPARAELLCHPTQCSSRGDRDGAGRFHFSSAPPGDGVITSAVKRRSASSSTRPASGASSSTRPARC